MDEDDEIALIRDSAAAVAPPGGDLRRVRGLRFTRPGIDPATWTSMREMGWIGFRVPEEQGGAGLGLAAYCALAEQLGAGLVPEPLIEAVLAATLHPALLDDARLVLPAWQERANTIDPGGATLLRDNRLRGKKLFVPMAAAAGAFLVAAGGRLALVAADAPGVTLAIAETQDGGHYGTLTLDDAACETLRDAGAPDAVLPDALGAALDDATLATAAALLGVMERAFELTLDYLKTRQQFGRAIGGFQALQHRAVDLRIQIALSRASIEAAARAADTAPGSAAARAAISRAKARASDAAMLVTREAVQFHGAIGYTDEYDVGLFLRRAMVLANRYGGAALHRARATALEPENEDG